jgi:hypothetical protein
MGGLNPRDGIPFRGDSNTHTIETPRSRAHIKKAEISRLENGFGWVLREAREWPRFKLLFNI